MLSDRLTSFCKESDLFFWFPDINDKHKVKTIVENLEESFNISKLEAPFNHHKKDLVDDLNLFLTSGNNKFKKGSVVEPNGH
jgi:hypothetical protein